MTSKVLQGPRQPVSLTDTEDVFCRAVGLDVNEDSDRRLLSEIRVCICTMSRVISVSSTDVVARR